MPRTGIEPVTRGFSVLCSTNWAIWAYKTVNKLLSCGSRIWTYDLRVMSPTSFQTAPSRDILFLYLISQVKPMIGLEPITCWLQISCSANWATSADCLIGKWVVVDSNHRSNLQQIYSLSPLATRESTHSSRITAPDNIVLYTILFQKSRGFLLNFDSPTKTDAPKERQYPISVTLSLVGWVFA